ncbi:hypothetical protein MHU86_24881 [Fragilaria crotonensis]|nr:hypothetical protein MHU86_24881 [Fragilaria crotonensis]
MHSHSFNLARHLSNRNEPDLLHESLVEDSSADMDSSYSKEFCKAIANKMCVDSSFPSECKRFPDIMSELRRRNSDKSDHAIAFAGMSAGEQAAAMAARESGHLAHAQVQRRLTSSRHTFQK